MFFFVPPCSNLISWLIHWNDFTPLQSALQQPLLHCSTIHNTPYTSLYNVQCTVYSVHCIIQYTLYTSLHTALYCVHTTKGFFCVIHQRKLSDDFSKLFFGEHQRISAKFYVNLIRMQAVPNPKIPQIINGGIA